MGSIFIAREHLPLGAKAVIFAVPCPLEGFRADVKAVSGGNLQMDETRCTPKRYHLHLPFGQMGWMHHEVGKVDVSSMDLTLQASYALGFKIPDSMHQPRPGSMMATSSDSTRPSIPSTGQESTTYGVSLRTSDSLANKMINSQESWIPPSPNRTLVGHGQGMKITEPVKSTTPGASQNHECQHQHQHQHACEIVFLPRPSPVVGGSPRRRTFHPHVAGGPGRNNTYDLADKVTQPDTLTKGCSNAHAATSSKMTMPGARGKPTDAVADHPASNQRSSIGGDPVRVLHTGRSSTTHEALAGKGTSIAEQCIAATEEVAKGLPDSLPGFCRVVVVGGGASGLSTAACLRMRGEEDVIVLERSVDNACGSWKKQYEGLKITTRRMHSCLPGWPVPREGILEQGNDVISAHDFVRYLRGYQRRFDVNVVLGAEVVAIERHLANEKALNSNEEKGGIRIRVHRGGDYSALTTIRCEHLIVATGMNSLPYSPPSVLDALRGFSGGVLHSSRVSGLKALARRRVCIVGMGNSACDLAVALLEHGAEKVDVSTRSAPPIIMREWGPISLEWTSRLVQIFSPWFVDMILATFAAVRWGKGWRTRCFPKGLQQTWQACSSCRIPSVDKGSLVSSMLTGRIVVHGPIERSDGSFLKFQHSGVIDTFDMVILATGFEPTHERLIEPALLEEGARRGLHLVGFNNGRALLPLRQIGAESRNLARRIVPRSKW